MPSLPTTRQHQPPDTRSGIYEERPPTCPVYTTENCEYHDDWTYDHYFETPEQIAEYTEAVYPSKRGRGIRSPKPPLLPLMC